MADASPPSPDLVHGLISFADIVITAAMGVLGWVLNFQWREIGKVRDEMNQGAKQIRDKFDEMPATYARRDDVSDAFKELKQQMKDGFDRLYDKLDDKADRH